jgi:phosphatidylglycerophosphatase A
MAWFFHWDPTSLLIATAVAAAAGSWSGTITARASGRKDPGLVVIDEVAGQWLTLAFATGFNPKAYAIGFLLFRLFDIWKPFPVRRLEKLEPEGWGIMADDLGAGVYAGLCLYAAGCLGLY